MSMIKSLHWDITKNCNLRCKHCYNAEKYFDEKSKVYISSEMNLNQCIDTVKKIYNAGFKQIHFLGGEPLVSPYLFDIIRYAKELGMIVTINSNACLLDIDMQKKLIDFGVDQFAASLDGCTAYINDSIRGYGTFERVVSNMKSLNELKIKCNSSLETALVFTLTKKNLNELTLLPSLACDLGVDLIVLTTFIESGKGKENYKIFQIDFDIICDSIELMVSKELIKYKIPLQIDMRPRFCEYLAITYNAPVIYNIKNSLCCAGEEMWYLEANGDVHPCLIFQLDAGKDALCKNIYTKENINISTTEIEAIEKSKYWNTFIKAKHCFETDKIITCEGCSYINECQPCFLDYGGYSIPVPECEWTKEQEKIIFEQICYKKISINDDMAFFKKNNTFYKMEEPLIKLDSETSKEIWKLIEMGKTTADIIKQLIQKYGIDENTLRYDVISFLFTLKNYSIIDFEGRE